MLKACWKRIESNLNRFKLHSTSIQHFLCSRKCWMVLKLFEHSVQHLSSLCPTSVQLLLNELWSNVETVCVSHIMNGPHVSQSLPVPSSSVVSASQGLTLSQTQIFFSVLFSWHIGHYIFLENIYTHKKQTNKKIRTKVVSGWDMRL